MVLGIKYARSQNLCGGRINEVKILGDQNLWGQNATSPKSKYFQRESKNQNYLSAHLIKHIMLFCQVSDNLRWYPMALILH